MKLHKGLLKYASTLQGEALRTVNEFGSLEKAAEFLGVSTNALRCRIERLEAKAAAAGFAPKHVNHPVPKGYHVKGVSTLYKDGKQVIQWVKTNKDQEDRLEALAEAIQTIADPIRGKSEPVACPQHASQDLLAVYTMGDPHLGMLANAAETGENFDLKIAESLMFGAIDHLVAGAPWSKYALIINLGDFFHSDNSSNRTARSGHALDVDGRWSKVLQVGIRAMRRSIDRALEKHEHVTVINEIGNHDDHSAIMLSLCLQAYYENNPRVTIDTSPAKFHYYRFGNTLIGTTHGDTCPPARLAGVMLADRKKDWAETDHHFWYTGHVHNDKAKELDGDIQWESFRTLASKDPWHAGQGYRSGRDMKCDVIHITRGRIRRNIVGIEELRGAA